MRRPRSSPRRPCRSRWRRTPTCSPVLGSPRSWALRSTASPTTSRYWTCRATSSGSSRTRMTTPPLLGTADTSMSRRTAWTSRPTARTSTRRSYSRQASERPTRRSNARPSTTGTGTVKRWSPGPSASVDPYDDCRTAGVRDGGDPMTDVRPVPHGTHRHLWRGASMVLAVLMLAACTGSGPGDGPLSPGDAPDGWHEVDRGLVTFSVPAALGDGDDVDPAPRAPDERSFVVLGQTGANGGRPGVGIDFLAVPE